jgi:hypothetical protein
MPFQALEVRSNRGTKLEATTELRHKGRTFGLKQARKASALSTATLGTTALNSISEQSYPDNATFTNSLNDFSRSRRVAALLRRSLQAGLAFRNGFTSTHSQDSAFSNCNRSSFIAPSASSVAIFDVVAPRLALCVSSRVAETHKNITNVVDQDAIECPSRSQTESVNQ